MKNLISTNKIFVDTNIVLYAIENQDKIKAKIAVEILENRPYISNKILNELMNLLHNKRNNSKFQKSKEETVAIILELLKICPLTINSKDTYFKAKYLMDRYRLSLHDSIVVSDAFLEGCDILYSEDMHDGLLVDKKMKIINPFK